MSTVAEIESAIAKLPTAEKAEVAMSALRQLYPDNEKAVRRALFRLEHPEIPDLARSGFRVTGLTRFRCQQPWSSSKFSFRNWIASSSDGI